MSGVGEGSPLSEAAAEARQDLRSGYDLLRWAASRFNGAGLFFGHGTDNAVDEAMVLLLHTLQLPHGTPDALLNTRMTGSERAAFLDLVVRRIAERVPVPYLTREAWFAGLSFYVDERVLVPRSPIAELIENGFEPWLGEQTPLRILDLCTGSGCIALACAASFTEAGVDALDVSDEALEVARINVERHAMQDRVQVLQSDVFDGLNGDRYDLIVSNPPYVDAGEMDDMPAEFRHEPRLGLEAGDDGLDIVHRILAEAADHLSDEGVLIVEVGASQFALMAAYPHIPFLWLDFERGGDGVFLLTAEQLRKAVTGDA